MVVAIERPGTDEYAPYYGGYIDRVPAGDIIAILGGQIGELKSLLGNLTDEQGDFRFAPGEWTIKEVVGHLVDTERAFGYRAFAFSRNDSSPMPGIEQDDYVREGNFGARSLADLREELALLRGANLLAYRYLTAEISQRRGVASGMAISVRALLYTLAGHIIYHEEDLREQYLPGLAA